MNWKKYLLLTVSVLLILLPMKSADACMEEVLGDEYRFWILMPEIVNMQELLPFTFSSDYIYGDNWLYFKDLFQTQEDALIPSQRKNVDEWFDYLDGTASKKSIDSVLYHVAPVWFFAHADDSLMQFDFTRKIRTKKLDEAWRYLYFAKKCEQVTSLGDPWNEEFVDIDAAQKVTAEGWSFYDKAQSPFIRLRLAYQLLRLNWYQGRGDDCIHIYDQLIKPVKSGSWVKGSAIYFRALMMNGMEKDYWLSKAFDQSLDKRSRCVLLFNRDSIQKILPYAKNNHERAVLWVMHELQDPGRALPKLQQIYALDPSNKDMKFLLLREANKLEDWLITPELTSYSPSLRVSIIEGDNDYENENYKARNMASDFQYMQEVRSFINQLIVDGRQKDRSLMYLLAGYLSMLSKDYSDAEWLLNAADNHSLLPDELNAQIKLVKILNAITSKPVIDSKTENLILDYLKLIDEGRTGFKNPFPMKDQLLLFLSGKFMEKGDIAKGIFLLGKTKRRYGDFDFIWAPKNPYHILLEKGKPADYDKMISILKKNNPTTFEKYLRSGYIRLNTDYWEDPDSTQWDANKIWDFKGTYFMNRDLLDSALSSFNHIPDSFWNEEPYNLFKTDDPFALNIYDAHNFNAKDRGTYNKRTFVKKLIELKQDAIVHPQNRALDYYKIGNAYYSMTWFGKYWIMNRIWWGLNEAYMEKWDLNDPFNKNYYGCRAAQKFYLLAQQNTKDEKFASLCCFMAGACEGNYRQFAKGTEGVVLDVKKNPYEKILRSRFGDTDFYDELVTECTTYADFIAKYN